jgi:uncharacterized protein (TIGR01777 family)
MDIAITGSSGLIGSALIEALRARGDRVVRVVRRSPGADEVQWDIDAGTIDAEGLEGIDAVVHLAGEGIGEKKWTPEQKRKVKESRTKGTALLSDALAGLTNKPSVFISGSAIGYYGNRGDEVLLESSTPGNDFLSEVVTAWEDSADSARDAGIRVAHIRTGIVLSTKGGALKEQLPFFKLGIGGKFGDGSQYWSWISITDQVAAILHILDGNISGPVNVTAPNPTTNAEFTTTLGKALNRPTFLPTPRFAVNIRLGAELAEALLFTSARVLPDVLQKSGFTFTHETLESALEDIL